MIKILIVDDSEIITGGLNILLGMEAGFEIVGCVNNGDKAVEWCRKERIDLVLMDVRMPEMNGVEATKKITEDEYIVEGIKNGASGYLLKTTEPKQLIQSIYSVMNGQSIFSHEVLTKAKKQIDLQKSVPDLSQLTPREKEIVHLVAKGMSNKQIASQLFLSEGTVNNSLSNILQKLALEHRTQLAIYYLTGKVGNEDGEF